MLLTLSPPFVMTVTSSMMLFFLLSYDRLFYTKCVDDDAIVSVCQGSHVQLLVSCINMKDMEVCSDGKCAHIEVHVHMGW